MLIVVVHRIVPETVALKQEAIPHTAIPDSTNHFSFVNTLWESEFDLACSVEGFQVFGGELEIQTGEIVLELRYLARSNEWDYWHRLIAQPDERYLGHAAADLRGDRLHRRGIRAARCSSGRNSFIPSLVIRAPSALPSP